MSRKESADIARPHGWDVEALLLRSRYDIDDGRSGSKYIEDSLIVRRLSDDSVLAQHPAAADSASGQKADGAHGVNRALYQRRGFRNHHGFQRTRCPVVIYRIAERIGPRRECLAIDRSTDLKAHRSERGKGSLFDHDLDDRPRLEFHHEGELQHGAHLQVAGR